MRFDFSKMRSTTALIFVLIYVAAVGIVSADDNEQCMCTCCKGDSCKSDMDMFPIQGGCTDAACIAACPLRYPEYCGAGTTVDKSGCMGDMSMAAQVFNRYTTLGAFILAVIATTMFRI
jgi:hypothetical protein